MKRGWSNAILIMANEAGKKFLDKMKVSAADKERTAHRNADNLLKLKV